MAVPAPRVHLTGALCVEAGGTVIGDDALPGRQGRVLFARLTRASGRPVAREDLAEALWGDTPPAAWEAALSALVSKLRSALAPTGAALAAADGCYRLTWPPGTAVDLEVAAGALDRAEGAVRAGDPRRAWAPAQVAGSITARPLLPGVAGAWVEAERAHLRRLRVRALDCLAEVWMQTGEAPLAVQAADEVVGLEPFRETGWRLLMRAHEAAGNVAEALRAYERCRRRLVDELGVDPADATEALHRALLAR